MTLEGAHKRTSSNMPGVGATLVVARLAQRPPAIGATTRVAPTAFAFVKIHGEPFVKLHRLDWRRPALPGAGISDRRWAGTFFSQGRWRVQRRGRPTKRERFRSSPSVSPPSLRRSGHIMIIKRFLRWVRTASPRARAAASGALARAYLYCNLSTDDRDAAENAMIALSDDPSPLVRRALAEALAASPDAPRAVVQALASDHRDIAAVVLARSPFLVDAEVVDFVATCDSAAHATIATRAPLRRAVAAAIAEGGSARACLVPIENPFADVEIGRAHV